MLGSPGNFKITATKVGEINLSWEPPFSLNLTTADPDIAYCVNVYNVTDIDGGFSPLISDCDVNTPSYTFTVDSPDPRGLFQFTITPRSNVEGARKGTLSHTFANFSTHSRFTLLQPRIS